MISPQEGDETPARRERICTPSVEGIVMIGSLEDGGSFGKRTRRMRGRIILDEAGAEEWVVVGV